MSASIRGETAAANGPPEPPPHRRGRLKLPPGAKANYKEAEKKRPGEFTGLVQPPVALRLRAFTRRSSSTLPARSAQSYAWD